MVRFEAPSICLDTRPPIRAACRRPMPIGRAQWSRLPGRSATASSSCPAMVARSAVRRDASGAPKTARRQRQGLASGQPWTWRVVRLPRFPIRLDHSAAVEQFSDEDRDRMNAADHNFGVQYRILPGEQGGARRARPGSSFGAGEGIRGAACGSHGRSCRPSPAPWRTLNSRQVASFGRQPVVEYARDRAALDRARRQAQARNRRWAAGRVCAEGSWPLLSASARAPIIAERRHDGRRDRT
jgi:hypothetical protein